MHYLARNTPQQLFEQLAWGARKLGTPLTNEDDRRSYLYGDFADEVLCHKSLADREAAMKVVAERYGLKYEPGPMTPKA